MAYRKGDKPLKDQGYALEKLLGRGTFGEVWRARAAGGTHCAMKFINLDARGIRELKAIAHVKDIRHPNLVEIQSIWLRDADGELRDNFIDIDVQRFLDDQDQAELIIIMGLGERSLFDRLKECRGQKLPGIPSMELMKYMEAAANGIDYLNEERHNLGESRLVSIQHRDIKPDNIVIVGGSAQVCDFGLAKVLANDSNHISRSSVGAGSPAYLPPEALSSKSGASKTGDQYSLAISYYEMRRGRFPFESDDVVEVYKAKQNGNLIWPDLGMKEQAVLKRATDLDPDKRFASCSEFVMELLLAIGSKSSSPKGTGAYARPQTLKEMQQPGGEIVPFIFLEEELGGGAFGKVWRASKKNSIRPVAVKIVNLVHEGGDQELKSLRLLHDLEHPNLIRVDEVHVLDSTGRQIDMNSDGTDSGVIHSRELLVIVMELADRSLAKVRDERVKKGEKPVLANVLLRYMDEAADAIDYLNAKGIQHRDIKPENIMLSGGDRIKIADFGLAKLLEGGAVVIRAESRAFTPIYAAPEVWDNRLSDHTDQYSLAITYYELSTGKPPFSSSQMNLTGIMRAHIEGNLRFEQLAGLPCQERVLRKATAKEPDDRYANCRAFVNALRKAISDDASDFILPSEEDLTGAASSRHETQVGALTPGSSPSIPRRTIQPVIAKSKPAPVLTGRETVPHPTGTITDPENLGFETQKIAAPEPTPPGSPAPKPKSPEVPTGASWVSKAAIWLCVAAVFGAGGAYLSGRVPGLGKTGDRGDPNKKVVDEANGTATVDPNVDPNKQVVKGGNGKTTVDLNVDPNKQVAKGGNGKATVDPNVDPNKQVVKGGNGKATLDPNVDPNKQVVKGGNGKATVDSNQNAGGGRDPKQFLREWNDNLNDAYRLVVQINAAESAGDQKNLLKDLEGKKDKLRLDLDSIKSEEKASIVKAYRYFDEACLATSSIVNGKNDEALPHLQQIIGDLQWPEESIRQKGALFIALAATTALPAPNPKAFRWEHGRLLAERKKPEELSIARFIDAVDSFSEGHVATAANEIMLLGGSNQLLARKPVREKAVTILLKASSDQGLEAKKSALKFEDPFNKGELDAQFELLGFLQSMGPTEPNQTAEWDAARVRWGLVCWYHEKRIGQENKLEQDRKPDEAVSYLANPEKAKALAASRPTDYVLLTWIKSQGMELQSRFQEAVLSYRDIHDFCADSSVSPVPPEELYQHVYQPALLLQNRVKGAIPPLEPILALFHKRVGDLIQKHDLDSLEPFKNLLRDGILEKAIEHYCLADALDNQRGEYLLLAASAEVVKRTYKIKRIKKWLDQIKPDQLLARDVPRFRSLEGVELLCEARDTPAGAKQNEYLKKALEDLRVAIGSFSNGSSEWRAALRERSRCLLLQAQDKDLPPAESSKILKSAIADAHLAKEGAKNQSEELEALLDEALATEDLELIGKESGGYEQCTKLLLSALAKLRRSKGTALTPGERVHDIDDRWLLLACGRCYYRWYKVSKNRVHIEESENKLAECVSASDPRIRAEGEWFLGLVRIRTNNFDAAKIAFRVAAKYPNSPEDEFWLDGHLVEVFEEVKAIGIHDSKFGNKYHNNIVDVVKTLAQESAHYNQFLVGFQTGEVLFSLAEKEKAINYYEQTLQKPEAEVRRVVAEPDFRAKSRIGMARCQFWLAREAEGTKATDLLAKALKEINNLEVQTYIEEDHPLKAQWKHLARCLGVLIPSEASTVTPMPASEKKDLLDELKKIINKEQESKESGTPLESALLRLYALSLARTVAPNKASGQEWVRQLGERMRDVTSLGLQKDYVYLKEQVETWPD